MIGDSIRKKALSEGKSYRAISIHRSESFSNPENKYPPHTMNGTRFYLRELPRPCKPRILILRQADPKRLKWDLFIMVLAIWNCFAILFTIAFVRDPGDLWVVGIIDGFIDVAFFTDIVLNFNTSVIKENTGDEIFERKEIAKVYMKSGRFAIDLIATLPVNTILSLIGGFSKNVLAFGLLKLISVLRLSKIIHFMRVVANIKIYMRLLQLILLLFMYLHIGACI